jgi:hypothetical protein
MRIHLVLAAVIGVLSLIAPNAHAQLPSRDAASDQVGATPGEFRVDEAGNANYNIPLYALSSSFLGI